jgi:Glycosyltransferase family 87
MFFETQAHQNLSKKIASIHGNCLFGIYIVLIILAVLTPLVLWQLKKIDAAPIINYTRIEGLPFELFGGLISFILAIITWIEIKKRQLKGWDEIIPIVLGFFVSLEFLFNISETTFDVRFRSDYIAFEKGAKAILVGINPYLDTGNPYVYPPLVGQIMAFLYQIITHIPFLNLKDKNDGWEIVFYFFQCAQLLLLSLSYFLTYKLARKIGLQAIPSSLVVASLFIFNNSVIRTFNFHQTNLWILNCFLIGILCQKRSPFISGFAVALGIHIKMYPFILILPWMALRKIRLLLWTTIGLLLIAFLQTNLGSNLTLLSRFFDYLKVVSKPTPYRNNSINSIVYNFAEIPHKLFSTSFDFVPIIVNSITLIIGTWLVIRFIRREKIYFQLHKNQSISSQSYLNEVYRLYGHSMDAIALGLIISPSVYEHHFIVAIPLALWALVTRKEDKLIPAFLGVFLIFCVPTYDLFPLSFHRLIGLLMLVYLTAPDSTKNYFINDIGKV